MQTIPEELGFSVEADIQINATPDASFTALLHRLGPGNTTPSGESMKLAIEPWPGGRWYRDLDSNEGHLWGHIQVIKRPGLLEITGPLFMSCPVLSHLQFRIDPGDGAPDTSTLTLRHQAMGLIDPAHREGVTHGWSHMLEGVRSHAESH